MDSEVLVQTIRISSKCRYLEPWLTKGTETAARKSWKLYKKTLEVSYTEDITTYKNHRNLLNRLRRSTKQDYHNKKCQEYRSNTKKTVGTVKPLTNAREEEA